jgi:hypothetical protein
VAGPIKIAVTVRASRAKTELTKLSTTVQKLGRIKAFVFDRSAFESGFARPYKRSVHGVLADADNQRRFWQKKFNDYPPVGKAPVFTEDKNVSFRRAFRNLKALSGESRVTLAQLNQRVARFEQQGQEAFQKVSVKAEQFRDTAQETAGRVKAIALATAAVAAASRAFSALGGYLKSAVTAASELSETTSKVQTIFGDGADSVIAFAKTADKNLGLSENAALAAAASFGDMFLQLGIGAKQAQKLSTSTLQLAADLGSFSNVDAAEVTDMISAAYRGEYDSLQRLVPAINAARVEAEALALSHKKSAKELTAADKALAVNSILMKDSARAQGDYAKTSAGLANATRTAKAGLTNLSATIGSALTPSLAALVGVLNTQVLPFLRQLADRYAPRVNTALTGLATKLSQLDYSQEFDRFRGSVRGFFAEFNTPGAQGGPSTLKSLGSSAAVIAGSFNQLGAATGQGLADTLQVTGVVMGFIADHADTLAKHMPLLVGAFIAYRASVAAANIAQAANLPLKVAEVVVNRQLVKSNQALIASRVGVTTATTAGTTAETAATAAKGRGVVATAASRTAMLASAAATGIATAATNAFGLATKVAMIGPLGLVVAAIAAVIAIGYLVIKNWDTIKRVALAVFGKVRDAIGSVVGWVRDNWKSLVPLLLGPIGIAVGLIIKHKDKILGIFRGIKDGVVSLFKGIGGVISKAIRSAVNIAIDLANVPIKAVNKVAGKLPGVPELPEIPKLAKGGVVTSPTLLIAGEAGPEAIIPLRGNRFGGNVTINVTANITSNDPDDVYTRLSAKIRRDGLGLLVRA